MESCIGCGILVVASRQKFRWVGAPLPLEGDTRFAVNIHCTFLAFVARDVEVFGEEAGVLGVARTCPSWRNVIKVLVND